MFSEVSELSVAFLKKANTKERIPEAEIGLVWFGLGVRLTLFTYIVFTYLLSSVCTDKHTQCMCVVVFIILLSPVWCNT